MRYFLRNRINSTCMFFLSMYIFIIFTMRLCAQRNSCPKRTECKEDLIHTNTMHTNTHPNSCIPSRDLLKFIYRYAAYNVMHYIHMYAQAMCTQLRYIPCNLRLRYTITTMMIATVTKTATPTISPMYITILESSHLSAKQGLNK